MLVNNACIRTQKKCDKHFAHIYGTKIVLFCKTGRVSTVARVDDRSCVKNAPKVCTCVKNECVFTVDSFLHVSLVCVYTVGLFLHTRFARVCVNANPILQWDLYPTSYLPIGQIWPCLHTA